MNINDVKPNFISFVELKLNRHLNLSNRLSDTLSETINNCKNDVRKGQTVFQSYTDEDIYNYVYQEWKEMYKVLSMPLPLNAPEGISLETIMLLHLSPEQNQEFQSLIEAIDNARIFE